MSNFPSFDPSIPVLTEVFQEPAAAAASAVDWEALERRLFEHLMENIHGQIESAVERAMQLAIGDIRNSVRGAVKEIIAQEISRLKSPTA
ncbi:MAG: hypothetical protein JWP59_314 [Massilia sp.]|jgi:hypothetical protein|nr:hypothetical protein [Massilia sp.]